jgi:uncharacterized membrane protein YccC
VSLPAVIVGEITTLCADLAQELRELSLTTPRARQCTAAALSVALSVAIALWLRIDEVWWAGISAFICSRSTLPASIERGILRIVGTAIGAALAMVMVGWLAYDHVACCLVLLLFSTVGVFGSMVGRYGYAWLFAGITANLVLLISLDEPTLALHFAYYRTLEVAVGVVSALAVATTLAPAGNAAPTALPPGFTDLFGARWPILMHALRGGVAVAVLPVIWNWLQIKDLSQMAVTVAAVLAIPSLSLDPGHDARLIARRAGHRMAGCVIGGVAGLMCLTLDIEIFPLWLLVLGAGVWIGAHIQASTRGIGYAGTQAAVVFITTMAQGWGPAESILPGIERFIGITLGLVTLVGVTALLAMLSIPDGKEESASF